MILLDTCALLYLTAAPDRFNSKTLELVASPNQIVHCSPIVTAELACRSGKKWFFVKKRGFAASYEGRNVVKDKKFLNQALQLQAPWFVRGVKLDLQGKKVELEIGVEKGWRWKDSAGRAAQVHGWEERQWRHFNTMQCETTTRARVPRLKCTDGSTKVAAVPWAERYTR